jgi:hypothetical protein
MKLVKIVIYLKNRSSIKLLLDTTPWESLYKKNLIFLIFELLDYSSTIIMSKQKLVLIDELNQIPELVRQD